MYRPTRRDFWLALALMAGTIVVLSLAQRSMGVMRDEATYFRAAESYSGWFQELAQNIKNGQTEKSLEDSNITRYYRNNNEHPVLFKTLMSFSWRALYNHEDSVQGRQHHPIPYNPRGMGSLGLFSSEISAFRAPGWLFTGICVALIYLLGVRIMGRAAGLSAALLYITIPRVFFHGQLACFDSAVSTMWLATIYAYLRGLESRRWALFAGVIFGLTLATKHNAWFLPPLLLLHYLMVVWPDLSLRPLRLPRVPLVFISMAILGPLVFWAHWPWLWFDTIEHLKGYFSFHLHHSYYNMEFLGQNWGQPPLPMAYPFVMTLFTVPTILLLLGIAGGWFYLRSPITTLLARFLPIKPAPYDSPFRRPANRSWTRPGVGLDPLIGRLLLINALFPLALIALPSTPIFGGTKHWIPAYPFWCLLAGVALHQLCRHLPGPKLFAAALVLLAPLPGALSSFFTQPYGLSQYNALAGGPAGGADLGLNRQFWGYPVRTLLPWMNETFQPNTSVYFHDTSYDAYGSYIRDGLLRPDIRYAGMELGAIRSSKVAMVFHELHFNKYDYWIWNEYGTAQPVKVLDLDGVPLLTIYQRPERHPGKRPQKRPQRIRPQP